MYLCPTWISLSSAGSWNATSSTHYRYRISRFSTLSELTLWVNRLFALFLRSRWWFGDLNSLADQMLRRPLPHYTFILLRRTLRNSSLLKLQRDPHLLNLWSVLLHARNSPTDTHSRTALGKLIRKIDPSKFSDRTWSFWGLTERFNCQSVVSCRARSKRLKFNVIFFALGRYYTIATVVVDICRNDVMTCVCAWNIIVFYWYVCMCALYIFFRLFLMCEFSM